MSALGAALGIALDRVLGEPPVAVHPVALHGRATGWLESRMWADDRLRGAAFTAISVGAGVAAGRRAGRSTGATAVATTVAVAGRMLGRTAAQIGERLDAGDLDGARHELPALVGRDPSRLDADGIARAVIESVAENTVDAVVAPALWAAVAGPAGALGYRAANTLDAMVGHHTARYERFGWASARLDDVAGWVPARATAALVALVRPRLAPAVWRAVRQDAPHHPSPNAGVAEAAFAAALDLRLGGTTDYGHQVEERPSLGDGRSPKPADIADARRLADHVAAALTTLLVVAATVRRRAGRPRQR